MKNTKEVTALVSVFQGERFIKCCIENLVSQTLFDQRKLEIIVLEACSPENEFQLIEPYLRQYPVSIKYIRLEKRLSLYETWNLGAKLAKGKYLTSANVDDLHQQDCLERLAECLSRNPEVGLVYGLQKLFYDPNQTYEMIPDEALNLQPVFFAPLALLQHPCGSQPMWRKVLHQSLGGFNESYQIIGDHEFTLRACSSCRVLRVEQALGGFLDHRKSLSRIGQRSELRRFQSQHYRLDVILDLYRSEGYDCDQSEVRLQVLEDFVCRCLVYFTVWGGHWSSRCNYDLAIIAAEGIGREFPPRGSYWMNLIRELRDVEITNDESESGIDLNRFILTDVGNNLDLMGKVPEGVADVPEDLALVYQKETLTKLELACLGIGVSPSLLRITSERSTKGQFIWIWGLGELGRRLQKLINSFGGKVQGFFDRNSEELQKKHPEFTVRNPEELNRYDDSTSNLFIVIATGDKKYVKTKLGSLGYVENRDFS